MSTPIDTAALRAKLRVYDQSLPRCQKRIVRVSNHAPDYVSEEERGEWEMRLDEVERLHANHDLAAERLAALLDAERENTALRELLDAKSHEAGLYARRMEQAQRSRDEARAEERAAVVALLRSGARAHDEANVPVFAALIAEYADLIEIGTPRHKED